MIHKVNNKCLAKFILMFQGVKLSDNENDH